MLQADVQSLKTASGQQSKCFRCFNLKIQALNKISLLTWHFTPINPPKAEKDIGKAVRKLMQFISLSYCLKITKLSVFGRNIHFELRFI